MTHSFHGGVGRYFSPQSKCGSWTTPLPTEFVTSRAYGSILDSSPHGVWSEKRYSSPILAPGTSAYQYPSGFSRVSGCLVLSQLLNVPTTETASACGAQTRKATPLSCGIAP